HHACRSIAAHEIMRRDALGRAASRVGELCRNALVMLRERIEPSVVTDLDGGEGFCALGQNGVEIGLWAGARRLRRDVVSLARGKGGELHAQKLASAQALHIDEIARMVLRPYRRAHGRGDAPAAAELHAARAHHALLRHWDRAVAFLDEHRGNAARAELASEREPDGTCADDEDGCRASCHFCASCGKLYHRSAPRAALALGA